MLGMLFWYVVALAEDLQVDGPLQFERVPNGIEIRTPRRTRLVLVPDYLDTAEASTMR